MLAPISVLALVAASASAGITTTAGPGPTGALTTPTAATTPGVKASYIMTLKKYQGPNCESAPGTTEAFPMDTCQRFFNTSANATDSWYTTHNGTHFLHTRSFNTGDNTTCKGVPDMFTSTIKMGVCSTLEENVQGKRVVRSEIYALENWGFDTSAPATVTGELRRILFNAANTTDCPDIHKVKVTGNSNIDFAGTCMLHYSVHEDMYANGTTYRYSSTREQLETVAKQNGNRIVWSKLYPAGEGKFLRLVYIDDKCTTVASPIEIDNVGPVCAVNPATQKALQIVFNGTTTGSVAVPLNGPIPTPVIAPIDGNSASINSPVFSLFVAAGTALFTTLF